jgi:hypothetical protein
MYHLPTGEEGEKGRNPAHAMMTMFACISQEIAQADGVWIAVM